MCVKSVVFFICTKHFFDHTKTIDALYSNEIRMYSASFFLVAFKNTVAMSDRLMKSGLVREVQFKKSSRTTARIFGTYEKKLYY
jgi:hypothetical protein